MTSHPWSSTIHEFRSVWYSWPWWGGSGTFGQWLYTEILLRALGQHHSERNSSVANDNSASHIHWSKTPKHLFVTEDLCLRHVRCFNLIVFHTITTVACFIAESWPVEWIPRRFWRSMWICLAQPRCEQGIGSRTGQDLNLGCQNKPRVIWADLLEVFFKLESF